MISFAHIIHPVRVEETSDLFTAQPITFETMRIACEYARGGAAVKLYSVQYQDESDMVLPSHFTGVRKLSFSILDIKRFKQKRKLARIKDILDRLYESSPEEYMIYTNADIGLQPYFYEAVSKIAEKGYDAFVINRRTLPDTYKKIGQIPLMYAEPGMPHPGYDCFVFKRSLYPKFRLGDVCIGTAWIGRALLANMLLNSEKFREFKDLHLTFHIGDSVVWRGAEYDDYFQENHKEYMKIIGQLESEKGPFETVTRSYLLDTGAQRQFPDFK